MKRLAIVCALVACFLLTGCAHRPVRPNYDLPVSCVRKVTMLRCDPKTEPPVCERIAVAYAKGCARMILSSLP